MRRAVVAAGLLAAALCFQDCATSTKRVPRVPKTKIAFHEENLQSENEAVIYVYRLRSMLGAMASWNVRLDGKVVAVLRQNAYIPLHVAPGAHSLIIGDQALFLGGLVGGLIDGAVRAAGADNADTFLVAAKESYYLRSQGAEVEFVTQEEAMGELSRLHFISTDRK